MNEWKDDIRFGLRMLARRKGLTLLAGLALALGLGMNIAIFSAASNLVWRGLPYAEPERLVSVWGVNPKINFSQTSLAPVSVEDFRAGRSFAAIAAYQNRGMAFRATAEPKQLLTVHAGPEFFEVLGGRAVLGRTFDETERGPGEHRTAILSDAFWKRELGGDPGWVGRDIVLDGRNYTVAGILPPEFTFLFRPVDLYVPLYLTAEQARDRNRRFVGVIGRLAPGVSPAQATAEMGVTSKRIEAEDPVRLGGWSAFARPLDEEVIPKGAAQSINVLVFAVFAVLLIACSNVASLLLARGTLRRRELAVRSALGAGRARILRLLLTESVLLSIIGGVAGIVFAYWAVPVLRTLAPQDFPRLELFRLDAAALGYGVALCLAAGVMAGFAPAWLLTRDDLNGGLREGARGSSGGGAKALQGLAGGQVAVATALLIVTALLVRSLLANLNADPGFDTRNLITANLALPQALYPEAVDQNRFYDGLLARLHSDPRLQRAAITGSLPLSGNNSWVNVEVEGRPLSDGQRNMTGFLSVSSGYFETLELPLLAGRAFSEQDHREAPLAAVVNQTMAKRYWPDDPRPLGRRFRTGGGMGFEPGKWVTVVGIVRDNKHNPNLTQPARPEYFAPLAQSPGRNMTLVVRTKGDPAAAAPILRAAVAATDPNLALAQINTIQQVLDRRYGGPRATAQILGFLSFLALLLSALGIYGVIAYLTAQRTREIGVRLALGAAPGGIFGLVLRRGAWLAGIGLAAGLVVAGAAAPLLANLLSGIQPYDPASFLLSALVLFGIALGACILPALRAMRLEPTEVLRQE